MEVTVAFRDVTRATEVLYRVTIENPNCNSPWKSHPHNWEWLHYFLSSSFSLCLRSSRWHILAHPGILFCGEATNPSFARMEIPKWKENSRLLWWRGGEQNGSIPLSLLLVTQTSPPGGPTAIKFNISKTLLSFISSHFFSQKPCQWRGINSHQVTWNWSFSGSSQPEDGSTKF